MKYKRCIAGIAGRGRRTVYAVDIGEKTAKTRACAGLIVEEDGALGYARAIHKENESG